MVAWPGYYQASHCARLSRGIVQFVSYGDTVLNWDDHCDDEIYSVAEDSDIHLPGDPWTSYGGLDCANWVNFVRNINVKVQQMIHMPFPKIDESVKLFIAASLPYTSTVCDAVLMDMLAGMGNVDFDLSER